MSTTDRDTARARAASSNPAQARGLLRVDPRRGVGGAGGVLALLLVWACAGCGDSASAPRAEAPVGDAGDVGRADDGGGDVGSDAIDGGEGDAGGEGDTGGPRPARDVRVGVALNGAVDPVTGAEEPFEAQRAEAAALGAEFVNLPLDWRLLEPGPSDDFSYAVVDPNRWVVGGVAPSRVDCAEGEVFDACLRWSMGASEAGFMHARYTLSGEYEVAFRVRIPADAAPGSALSLILDGGGGLTGGRCAEASDVFGAVVVVSEEGGDALAIGRCEAGVFETVYAEPLGAEAADGVRVRVRRTATESLYYVGERAAPVATSSPTAAVVRPWVYASGDAARGGEVTVMLDDWSVGASANTFDEPSLRYSVDPGFFDVLGAVSAVFGDIPVGFSVRTINTNRTELPSDLEALIDPRTGRVAFDDPRVAARFDALVAHMLGRIGDDVVPVFFSVGNEVDIYLGDDVRAWRAYADFVEAVAPGVRGHLGALQGAPDAPVGAKITKEALRYGPEVQAQVDRIVAASDVAMVNYYPFEEGGFVLASEGQLREAVDALVGRYAPLGRPIYVTEFGVHSVGADAPVCGLSCDVCSGSEALQAERYAAFFDAVASHEEIGLVMLNWLTDVPCARLDEWALQYGSSADDFLGFLGSLGLRRRDGTRKPAFDVVAGAIQARGW